MENGTIFLPDLIGNRLAKRGTFLAHGQQDTSNLDIRIEAASNFGNGCHKPFQPHSREILGIDWNYDQISSNQCIDVQIIQLRTGVHEDIIVQRAERSEDIS